VLQRARGLAVFQVIKAGFVFSGKAGSGLVVARLPDGSWSAPSCIATGGVGWGLQIGADITDFVIVLNTEDAIRAFSVGGNVTIGGSISAAAGPIGTGGSVQATLAHPAPMFSYSKSKGALGVIWWLLLARLCSACPHRLVCRAFARGHGAY
jgi:lipid-binding SYLF domain-containing protein